ncbi:MAG: NlpC/P60 family protein [Sphingopyxis sp.]
MALVGTRYRLHGRSTEHGLDCVGLVALSYARAGLRFTPPPDDYRLRGAAAARIGEQLARSGFVHTTHDEMRFGDVVLCDVGRGQQHLSIASPDAHIHAHAGLRRVVLTPGVPAGDVLECWRVLRRSHEIIRK